MFHNLDGATLDGCQNTAFSIFAKSLVHYSWTFVYFKTQVKGEGVPLLPPGSTTLPPLLFYTILAYLIID